MNQRANKFPEAAFQFDVPEERGTPPAPQQQGGRMPPGQGMRKVNFEAIKKELRTVVENGDAPEGFHIEEAVKDPAFIELVMELPANAAIRVYDAERRAEEAEMQVQSTMQQRMQQRNGLPQPTRADASAAPARDYMTMSPEEFAATEQRYKKLSRDGIQVKL